MRVVKTIRQTYYQAVRVQNRRPDGCGEEGCDGVLPREGLEDQAACQRDAGADVQCSLDFNLRDVVDEIRQGDATLIKYTTTYLSSTR